MDIEPFSHPDKQALGGPTALKIRDDFQYKPLETSNQFRLLILLPYDDKSARIVCQLLQASIQDAPPYEALSYT
jgi:hypothetical protein